MRSTILVSSSLTKRYIDDRDSNAECRISCCSSWLVLVGMQSVKHAWRALSFSVMGVEYTGNMSVLVEPTGWFI